MSRPKYGLQPVEAGWLSKVQPLEHAPEAHALGIEQPGAVAGLQDKRFHGWIIARQRVEHTAGVFRLGDESQSCAALVTRSIGRRWTRYVVALPTRTVLD